MRPVHSTHLARQASPSSFCLFAASRSCAWCLASSPMDKNTLALATNLCWPVAESFSVPTYFVARSRAYKCINHDHVRRTCALSTGVQGGGGTRTLFYDT